MFDTIAQAGMAAPQALQAGAIDPTTGKPYVFGQNTGQWSNIDPRVGLPGNAPIAELYKSLGWGTDDGNLNTVQTSSGGGGNGDGGGDSASYVGTTDKLGTNGMSIGDYLKSKGYTIRSRIDGTGGAIQAFDANGNPVGKSVRGEDDPETAFMLALLASGAGVGASIAGAGALGAGAAGAGGSGLDVAGLTALDSAAAGGGAGGGVIAGGGIAGANGIPLTAEQLAGYQGLVTGSSALPTTAGGVTWTGATGAGLGTTEAGLGAGVAGGGAALGGGGTAAEAASAGLSGGVTGGGAGAGAASSASPGIWNSLAAGDWGGAASGVGDWATSPSGINTLGGLASGLLGTSAAGKAADAQRQAAADATALQKYMYDTTRADYAPYRAAGTQALGGVTNLLANPGSIVNDPSYKFGLDQGQTAIDRSAAGKGGLYSGATLKALERYGQDYAGTKLDQTIGRYTNVAQLGATGVAGTANAGANYANQAGANITGAGNATAAADLYGSNVWQSAINNGLANYNRSTYGTGATSPYGRP